jgi:hypothetical protein
MSIPITHEPLFMFLLEACCFCHQPSAHWTDLPDRTPGQQVACCPGCADIFEPDVVPTKREWRDYWDAQMPRRGRW